MFSTSGAGRDVTLCSDWTDEEEGSRKSAKESARLRAMNDACTKISSKTPAEKILCDWNKEADNKVTDIKEDIWNMGGDVTNKNDTKLVSCA